MASTKCSWNRGSTAVFDLLDPPDDALDLATGRAGQERDEGAGPGSVARGMDVRKIAVRDEPQDHRVGGVDLAAERAGETDLVDRVDAELIHQQADPGIQRGLGELDGTDVVLGDDHARPARDPIVQDVARRPAIGDDPRGARRERPVHHAVLGDHAGEEQFGDDLDDPEPQTPVMPVD